MFYGPRTLLSKGNTIYTILPLRVPYSTVVACWQLNKRMENRLLVTEIDYWRRLVGITKTQTTTINRIREVMKVKTNIKKKTQHQPYWYGQVEELRDKRLQKLFIELVIPQKMTRGRPTWMVDGWHSDGDVGGVGMTEKDEDRESESIVRYKTGYLQIVFKY